MRIAFVVDRFRPGKGGLERWLGAFGEHLAARGDEVSVVSMDRDVPPPFTHLRIAPRGLTRVRRDRGFAEAAAVACAQAGFDVVAGLRHCLSCTVYVPHGGSAAAAFAGERGSPRARNFVALERALLDGPSPPKRILAVSEAVRRDLAARYPAIAPAIRVVPNGVDLGRFTPEGREQARAALAPAGGRVLLFLAANPRLKGVATAKRVFEVLRARGAADLLLLAGGRPGRLREGMRWLGHLTRPEEAYRAADLLLLPTRYDPFPLALLESLACGTPVATTEANGALDHVGRTGPVRAVEDPGDVGEFARLSAEMLAGAPRAEARALAERFDLGRSFDAAAAVFRESAG
ncbi:MAG: glycosyltransferase family 4 protein [Planctomycetes bacterium]|jgi:UDP-glucose:(heptosyl)LPS alpha-1,3-glucosyltransferase|nr:glycosyltransferase family 4 protein [Planctomycetota bacterium]